MAIRKRTTLAVAVILVLGGATYAGTSPVGSSGAVQSDIRVTGASMTETTIVAGNSTTVTAVVTNSGLFTTSTEVGLAIDGETVQSKIVAVPGGDSRTVSFERTFPTAGSYDISVDGVSAGELTVQRPASFTVTEASLARTEIAENDTVGITAAVANTGDRRGSFEAELAVDGEIVETKPVTVGGGDTAAVRFDRRFADAGSYGVAVSGTAAGTLTVLTPADMAVTALAISPDPVLEAQPVEIRAEVENTGEATGEFDAQLRIDGSVRTTETVTVDGESTTAVVFEQTIGRAGTYDVRVSGSETETLTVDRPATFEVSGATLSESVILEGESTVVSGMVTNVGDRAGRDTLPVRVDGDTVDEAAVDLAPGQSEAFSVREEFGSPGRYGVAIGDTRAGRLAVDQPATFEIDDVGVNRSRALPGHPVGIALTVSNVGDRDGAFVATVTANDASLAERNVTIDAETTESVTVTGRLGEPGEYALAVDGSEAGTVVVDEPPTFEVANVTIPADLVAPGADTTAQLVVENPSNWTATRSINVTADGELVGKENVTLAPGERREMSVAFEATAGPIEVEGTEAGSVELIQRDGGTDAGGGDDRSVPPLAVFGLFVVIVAGVAGTYVADRRR